MKVLFVVRSDGEEKPGGDIVQLTKMVKYLTRLGVETEISYGLPQRQSNWDLVHVFNLETDQETFRNLGHFKNKGYPVAVSTIYCRTEEAQYEGSILLDPRWRRLKSLLGWNFTYKIWKWRENASPATRRRYQTQQQIVDRADLLFPNSKKEALYLSEYFDRPLLGEKTCVIPIGLDHEEFDPTRAEPERVRAEHGLKDFVLNVGRMTPRKNQLRLIQALRDSDLTLVFVGADHSYPQYLKDCQDAAALRKGRTLFLDWVAQADLVHWYAAARVLALPTIHETANLVCLEAAVCGCRVMSTLWAPVEEYFGGLAYTCDPLSADSIREATLAAWNAAPDKRLQEFVWKNFTWEAAAAKTFEAYRELISRRGRVQSA